MVLKKNNMKYKKYNNLFCNDFLYKNIIFNNFIKILIKNGKKIISQKIFYKMFNIIKNFFKKKKKKIIKIILKVIKKISIKYKFIKKKVGNNIINIPFLINDKIKRYNLGIKLIIFYSKKRKENNISNKLAFEIIDTYKKISNTYKKKIEINKTLKLNKNFIKI
ncbi:MAG: hypothetical protein ABNO82_00310 [Candidatus Shikimatogenerans sp. Tder]|uniref:Small ribosomal subunit protein uS7 domain-containing protein n=1 Tax=Candidatus Shikimatogenerans sp. Tder TaxID=3158566 RepID=A0AAU7QT88_9FLAO